MRRTKLKASTIFLLYPATAQQLQPCDQWSPQHVAAEACLVRARAFGSGQLGFPGSISPFLGHWTYQSLKYFLVCYQREKSQELFQSIQDFERTLCMLSDRWKLAGIESLIAVRTIAYCLFSYIPGPYIYTFFHRALVPINPLSLKSA